MSFSVFVLFKFCVIFVLA